MKMKMNRVVSLVLVFVMTFIMSSQIVLAEDNTTVGEPVVAARVEERAGVDYYGRNVLAEMDNATALLYAYDQIVAGVEEAKNRIELYNKKNALTAAEAHMVIDIYMREHPEHFWFGTSYSLKATSKSVTALIPTYTMTGDALAAARAEFDAAVEDILSGVKGSMSEYQKELYLHDAVAKRVTYQYRYTSNDVAIHTAYGALVDGSAVCDGYAKSLQYLLQCVGIQSFLAEGSSLNPGTGKSEAHAWNYVRIDGEYYHVDLTWDDQDSDLYHAYFNRSDAVMSQDHVTSSVAYALPSCSSDNVKYFKDKDEIFETYTVDSVAKVLKDEHYRAHVYLPGDKTEFFNWFNSNIYAIADALGIHANFGYQASMLGNEAIITINVECNHADMVYVPAVEATCTEDGNSAYYACTCEKWFTDAEATIQITDYESVVIEASGHTEVVDEAVEATCTTSGATEGKHCEACGEVLVAQNVVEALGHDEVIDEAVPPTETETGLTEGKHCETCGEILVPQKKVPTIGTETARISGTIASYGDETDPVTIELLDADLEVVESLVLEKGKKDYEFCVSQGEYTLRVKKTMHCPREYTVSMEELVDVELNAEIFLYGDANKDGRLRSQDLSAIANYMAGNDSVISEDDEYLLMVIDVNRDGRLRSQDLSAIANYMAGNDSVFDTME